MSTDHPDAPAVAAALSDLDAAVACLPASLRRNLRRVLDQDDAEILNYDLAFDVAGDGSEYRLHPLVIVLLRRCELTRRDLRRAADPFEGVVTFEDLHTVMALDGPPRDVLAAAPSWGPAAAWLADILAQLDGHLGPDTTRTRLRATLTTADGRTTTALAVLDRPIDLPGLPATSLGGNGCRPPVWGATGDGHGHRPGTAAQRGDPDAASGPRPSRRGSRRRWRPGAGGGGAC